MSQSKYVPPHMRGGASETPAPPQPPSRQRYHRKSHWELEKEEQARKQKDAEVESEKKRELTEENFPVLGSTSSSVKVWGGPKTFAVLATEWDDKRKKDELEKKQKEIEEQETTFHKRVTAPLPRFHNVHRFVEPEDDEEDAEHPVQQKIDSEEQGWVTVDRKKYRREKTIEEKLARPPTPEENDDTVWNGDAHQEHETCWDERH
jgi:hypothetical protein